MAQNPVQVQEADDLDPQKRAMAADDVAGLAGAVSLIAIVHGDADTKTRVSTASPLPVTIISEPSSGTSSRGARRVDLAAGVATLISGPDATFKSRLVVNPSLIDANIGHTNAVTATGSTTGVPLLAQFGNGGYSVGSEYTEEIYGFVPVGSVGAYVVVQEV